MKKVTAGAVALALAGIGSVALAGPASTQTVEDIPGLPETLYEADILGGLHGEFEVGRPGFELATISAGSERCTMGDGQVTAAIAIEIWQLQEDGPNLLDSGYVVSDADFWGDDPAQFFADGDLDGWTSENFPTPVGTHAGNFTTSFVPPAVNGEQIFVGHCIVVDGDAEMEGSADDLARSGEGFSVSYTVVGAGGDGGNNGDGGDDGNDDPPPAGDAPPATPVDGTPSFTG